MDGCEEKLLSDVPNSVRAAIDERIWLTYHRNNRARNNVPVRIQTQRDDRLNVENILRPSEWTIVEVGIVLEGNTNQSAIGFCDFVAKSPVETSFAAGSDALSARPLSNL